MKIIDKKETMEWLSERGLLDSKGELSFSNYPEMLQFRIPGDSGKKNVLSRIITSIISPHGNGLIWIDEYGVWPSCEDMNLFNRFRMSFGEICELNEKPGHVFMKDEVPDVSSLIVLVLFFCWGAVIVSDNGKLIIRISHDEMIDFFAKDSESLKGVPENFRRLLNK